MRAGIALVVVVSVSACGSVNNNSPDAAKQKDAPSCVPQSDTEFCTAASGCERHTGMDNCGAMRTVDCGACADASKGCVNTVCKTPECTTFTYTQSNFPNMSTSGVEDSIGGSTWDARVVLYVKTATGTCGNYHLVVADELVAGSGTYTQTDISTNLTALGLINAQEQYTITADGLTIITVTTDSKTMKSTTRSAIGMTDWGAASGTDFAAISAQTSGNSKTISAPVISADGLELWYTLSDTAAVIYSSVRSSTSVPFPAGTAAPAPVSGYPHVHGISHDRLTLIVFDGYSGRVFTRKSTSASFTNPNAPAAAPLLPGWDHKPLADCSKMIAMYSPGGCANEDVVVLTRQ